MASELKVNTITEATSGSGITFAKDIIPATPLSHRNMIINGAMNIHQRGGTISYAHDGTTSAYSLDRFKLYTSGTDEWDGTVAQHTMSSADYNTTGFSKAFLLTTGTAESAVASNESASIQQRIEAQNLQHLQYGTASAKSIILSFWVKASVTGTYAVGLYKADSTARVINKTIAISDTNWNKYTLTFPGDTDSGATIANDNGTGFYVIWHLMAGSIFNDGANTSWENYADTGWAGGHAQDGIMTTASATFYLTGVQLELGSVATPFEHRSYGEELARCERYCQKIGLITPSKAREVDRARACDVHFKTAMRANCTVPSISNTDNVSLTISAQSPDGFHCYYTATSDGMASGVNAGTIVTAEL